MIQRYILSLALSTLLLSVPMQGTVHWAQRAFDAYVAHYNELILFGVVAEEAYWLHKLYSCTELHEDDAFKKMVYQECKAMDMDGYPLFVKVSGDPSVENMLMGAMGGGIVVAQSMYDAYFQEDSDKDAIRFLVRHEASHIKNSDWGKRFLLKTALYLSVLYGSDYLFAQLQKQNALPGIVDGCYKQWLAKCCSIMLTNSLLTYIQRYHQEVQADRQACCDAALAEGGSRCFARLGSFIKENDPITDALQSQPFLWRLLSGYPTLNERSQMLHVIAEELSL